MDKPKIIEAFRAQAGYCHLFASAPITAALLYGAADDLEKNSTNHNSIMAEILSQGWAENRNPIADALPLRFAGAVHYLALCGRAAEIADFYPSTKTAGGSAPDNQKPPPDLWPAAKKLARREAEFITGFIQHPPQTNEAARSGILLGGFLQIADETHLPLQIYEIGASAGLNMLWDQFFYVWARLTGAIQTAPCASR